MEGEITPSGSGRTRGDTGRGPERWTGEGGPGRNWRREDERRFGSAGAVSVLSGV